MRYQRVAKATPALAAVSQSADREATRRELRERTPWRKIRLSASESYQRRLDLGGLYDFSRPGEYRVQVKYESRPLADWQGGEWAGQFTSPVFEVVITATK